MNPQTIRHPTDLMKVREAYLANLELEQKNLKKTEDAVNTLKQTGQVPLPPQDTRSVNEKLMDVEKLKINLRRQLMDITDGQQASEIMNSLSNQEVQSLSIVFSDIASVLQSKYKNGVPAPIFLEYARRYLKDFSVNVGLASGNQGVLTQDLKLTRDMIQRVMPSPPIMEELMRSIMMAPDSRAKEEAIAAARQLASSLPNLDDIAATQTILSEVELANLSSLITDALQQVPSADQVKKLTKEIINTLRNDSKKETENILTKTLNMVKIQQDELAQLNSISEALRQEQAESFAPKPTRPEIPESEVIKIAKLLGSKVKKRGGETTIVEKSTLSIKDRKLAEEISLLDTMSEAELNLNKKTFSKAALREFWEYQSRRDTGKPLSAEERKEFEGKSKDELFDDIISAKFSGGASFEIEAPVRVRKAKERAEAKQETAAEIGGISAGAQDMVIRARQDVAAQKLMDKIEFDSLSEEDQLQYMARLDVMGVFDGEAELKRFFEAFRDRVGMGEPVDIGRMYTQIKTFTGMGIKKKRSKAQNIVFGCGLTKSATRPKKIFSEKIDFSEGLPKDKSYIPFGKYVIHKHKLTGGILQVRTIKGGAIPKLPTLGISTSLGKIIKKMVGGGLPTYDEMSALNEDEKNTLYKVFKLSQIDKADLLPSPDKTKEESEMNRFQILKGQIQAGNDNGELIKEFKCLLMKFISGGKIPRGQGMEIVCELMAMGY